MLIVLYPGLAIAQTSWIEKGNYTLVSMDTVAIKQLIDQADKLSISHPDSSILLFKNTLRQSLLLNYTGGIINSMVKTGNVYRQKSSYAKAIEWYEAALSYCDTLSSSKVY